MNFKQLFESVFDTDIFKEVSKKYKKGISQVTLTPEQQEQIETILMCPDARPGNFDGTLEAWLLRISIWGKLKFSYLNTETAVKKNFTKEQFLDYVDNQKRNELYGKWELRTDKVNRIIFYRNFWSLEGKQVTEELLVEIELREDLKTKLSQIRKEQGLLAKFGF